MSMKVSILIVTYAKDIEWLRYCLKSIRKCATGFHEVVVVYPRQEIREFEPICLEFEEWARIGLRWDVFQQANPPLGQLHHQIQKCHADSYCSDSDFILHVDADCIFTESVTPYNYFVDDKPVLLIQSYESLGSAVPWKGCTEKALAFPCPFETMRRHPAIHYRYTYADVRKRVEEVHNCHFFSYVLAQKPAFPQGFSEFNALGSFALKNYPNSYHLIDVGKEPHPHSKLTQFWSHGGLDKSQGCWQDGKEIQLVPRQFIEKVLA